MSTGRLPRTPLEYLAAFALSSLAWAATWSSLRVGGYPVVLPAAGFGIAYLLLRGGLRWVPLVAGAIAGAGLLSRDPVAAAALGLTVTLPTLLAWGVLVRLVDPAYRLARMRDQAVFAMSVAAASAFGTWTCLALPGADALLPLGPTGHSWEHLGVAHLVGVLLFAPPVFAFGWRGEERPDRQRVAELALACFAALLAAGQIFLTRGVPSFGFLLVGLVVAPLVSWVTLRAPAALSTTLTAVVMLLATAGAARGLGPFGLIHEEMATRTLQSVGGALGLFTALLATNEFARRRALRDAREGGARLERVIEGSNDGFWEWDAATDVVVVSDRLARMFGYEVHEFIRHPHEYTALTHPDDEAASVAAVRGHFAGLTGHYSTEYRMRHRDGSWVWVLDRGRVTQRGPDGEPLRASGTMTDITERKHAETALRAGQELFESFMGHSPAIAFIRDRDGHLRWTNLAFQKFAWGGERTDYRDLSMYDLYPPEVAEQLMGSDAEVMETGRPVVAEQHLPIRGRDAWVLTVKFPLRRPDGNVLVGGMGVEITELRHMADERRELEARMLEAQKLEGIGLLAGGIAHDFNNLLTGILGHADLARVQAPPDSTLQQNLAQIVAGAQSAAELTQQMLTYAGRGRVAMRPLALPSLVGEMGHLLQVSVPKRVALEYRFEPGLPAIEGDETQLRQVVLNLIVNAAEAVGEASGTIRVRAFARDCDAAALRSRWASDEAAPGPHVVLEVSDTGCGIEPATLARVFDPFFTTKFTGRGLGLATVLGIVRGHRGVIQVESAPGAGTTFRVLLPALARSAPVRPPRPDEPRWRASGAALVVDDEPAVRAIACAMLGRLGFEPVLAASGGGEGLERFREHADRVQLVLLDVSMPDMDGHAVFERMRALRPDVRVLMSSGHGRAVAVPGDRVRPAGFVAKPYRLADLAQAVRAAFEKVPAAGDAGPLTGTNTRS